MNLDHFHSQKIPLLFVCFFHDIEKAFCYGPDDNEECNKWRGKVREHILDEFKYIDWENIKILIIIDLAEKFKEFDFRFSKEEINELKYTHGEGADHLKDKRVAGPLAAHVHHCDNISARIWFDKGKGLS